MKSGYSLNYYFILQTDSSGGKNHTCFYLKSSKCLTWKSVQLKIIFLACRILPNFITYFMMVNEIPIFKQCVDEMDIWPKLLFNKSILGSKNNVCGLSFDLNSCIAVIIHLKWHLFLFLGPKTAFTEAERKILEREEVYRQFKDLEYQGEFESANYYLQSAVKKQTASDSDSTTITVETGAY